jgi:hypothetical protein
MDKINKFNQILSKYLSTYILGSYHYTKNVICTLNNCTKNVIYTLNSYADNIIDASISYTKNSYIDNIIVASINYTENVIRVLNSYVILSKKKIDTFCIGCLCISICHLVVGKYFFILINKINSNIINDLALHYDIEEKNHDFAKQLYLLAISNGNDSAMYNLACRYDVEQNYEFANKYYLLASDHGNDRAMNNLGFNYEYHGKNYVLAKICYLMAIKKGNTKAMNNLACHYWLNEEKFELAKYYFSMGVNKGDCLAMKNFSCFYCDVEKNYELAKYYCLMIDNDTHLKDRTDLINEILRMDFNIKFAIDMREFLNQNNIDKLNQIISRIML